MATLRNLSKRLDLVKQQARANNLVRFRPIIVVCNDADVQEVQAARAAGAHGYISSFLVPTGTKFFIICNPQHSYLLGGSIVGIVVDGIDLATDI